MKTEATKKFRLNYRIPQIFMNTTECGSLALAVDTNQLANRGLR